MVANSNFRTWQPAQWQVSLTLPVGWEPVAPYGTSFDVTLNYGSTACVEVRFKVKRPINVEVLKIDDNHVPLADWVIRAAPASGNWFASPITATTDGNGIAAFRLTEGKWIFTEQPPSGQHYKPVMPSDGKQEVDVQWDDTWPPEGGKISIRFKNRLYFKGCIAVTKTDAPPDPNSPAYGLPDWKITVKRTDGSIAAEGYTDAQGNVRFSNLYYGPYIVTEEARLGWEAVGTTSYQVNVSRPQTDSPDNEGCELVDFINRQVPPGFSIEGYKIDHNGMIGIPGWIITATAVYKGDYPDPNVDFDPISLDAMSYLTATTDGTGKYVFTFPNGRLPHPRRRLQDLRRAARWLAAAHRAMPDGVPAQEARPPGEGLELREPAGRPLGEHHPRRWLLERQRQLQHYTCSYSRPEPVRDRRLLRRVGQRNAGGQSVGIQPPELLRVSRRHRLHPVSASRSDAPGVQRGATEMP